MSLPYKISTLLYCFNPADEVLLMRRAQEPNRGLWSPCGGKLDMTTGESPFACACREAGEEIGLSLRPEDLHLAGLISEHGYQGHVPIRSQTTPPQIASRSSRRQLRLLCRQSNRLPADPANRCRTDLAAVLETSRRFLRRPLPLRARPGEPMDDGSFQPEIK